MKPHPPDPLALLQDLLGAGNVLTGTNAAPYTTDWRALFHGHARFALRPATTEQAASAVAVCAVANIPIIPQGGNTGLAGGATPDPSGTQAILLLSRLNRIRDIDPTDLTLTAEAGCTLQSIRDAAAAVGLAFPLSIASGGTAQLGGILSTNAGGNHTLRHGNARDLTLGLEVILPDGRIWHGLRRLPKDNTGYALRHLFIGAEGTLGIITAATLRLTPAHRTREVALAATPSPTAALAILHRLRQADSEALHAYEYISGPSLRLVLAHMHNTTNPFTEPYEHYVLVELATARENASLRHTLETALAQALEEGIVLNAIIAASDAQRAALWRLREDQAEAQQRAGYTIKNDISVPVSAAPALIENATAACENLCPGLRIAPFGHLGDGNIHFNLVAPEGAGEDWPDRNADRLIHAVTEIARALGGSFSAEHGIGQLKTALLANWRQGPELDMMRAIKAALDPAGLLNPGKLFPLFCKHTPVTLTEHDGNLRTTSI